MSNIVDPDQLASSELWSQLIWSYTICEGRAYLSSAGPGLIFAILGKFSRQTDFIP